MPHFLLNHGPSGPLIDIWVGVSIPRSSALQSASQAIPTPVLVKALIDTGASHTSMDVALVKQLGLTPTGVAQVITPTTGQTPVEQLTYDISLFVPLPHPGSIPYTIPLWTVSATELQHQGFAVLYGRDLLSLSTLHYDGSNGMFTLTF